MTQISLSEIEQRLVSLLNELESSDIEVAQSRLGLKEYEESLEVSKINAALKASDGRNETERKLYRDKSVAEDDFVINGKRLLSQEQATFAQQEAYNVKLRREFAAYCHLAEMRAAQMILQSKGDQHV